MEFNEIKKIALELPPEARLTLARLLIDSVVATESVSVEEGVRRIEEILTGQVKGLTEAEFRAAVGNGAVQ
jgi:hypothetical protein